MRELVGMKYHSHASRTNAIPGKRATVNRDEETRPGSTVARERRGIIPWPVMAVVGFGALVNTAAGALSLVAPAAFLVIVGQRGERLTGGVHVFAAYAGARELALGVVLLVLLARRATRALPGLLVMTALANALDGVVALANWRWEQVPGAFVFAIVLLAAARWLFAHSHDQEVV